jgi:hypothetical protein
LILAGEYPFSRELYGLGSVARPQYREGGRDAHLNGRVAAALMEKAADLLAKPPAIHKLEILADKLPK